MTRTKLMTTAAAALIALPTLSLAESPQASTGTGTEVGSEQGFMYDTNSPRINNGIAEFDETSIAMSQDTFQTLMNARGEAIETTAGEKVGVIEGINVNAQGNPEVIVDLQESTDIPADVLVVTLQPNNISMEDGMLFIATTLNELELKAEKNSVRGADERVSVTLF